VRGREREREVDDVDWTGERSGPVVGRLVEEDGVSIERRLGVCGRRRGESDLLEYDVHFRRWMG
jgi:hypothetical protein